jgi:hypothetical protein
VLAAFIRAMSYMMDAANATGKVGKFLPDCTVQRLRRQIYLHAERVFRVLTDIPPGIRYTKEDTPAVNREVGPLLTTAQKHWNACNISNVRSAACRIY